LASTRIITSGPGVRPGQYSPAGGGIVEAFPLNVPGIPCPLYTGSVKMYEREGFEAVGRLGKNTVFMRLML
jgi:hypothetical protein